jgi:hypothetical protein
MNNYKEIILSTLKQRAISKRELYGLCGVEHSESEQRKVRRVMELLVNDAPVGSSSNNKNHYYICSNKQDLARANAEDMKRVKAFLHKIERRNYSFVNWETKKIVDDWQTIPVPEFLRRLA